MGYGSCLAAWYAVVSVGGYDGILPLFSRHHANRRQDWAGFDYLATSHVEPGCLIELSLLLLLSFAGRWLNQMGNQILRIHGRSCEHRDPANPVGLPAWHDVFFFIKYHVVRLCGKVMGT